MDDLGQSLNTLQTNLSEGIETAVSGLDDALTGLKDFSEKFDAVSIRHETSATAPNNPVDQVRSWIFDEVNKLLKSLTGTIELDTSGLFDGSSSWTLGTGNLIDDSFFSDSLDELLPLTQVGTSTDPQQILEEIGLPDQYGNFPEDSLLGQIANLVGSQLQGQFLSLLPAKRLEVQLSWSEYKNDRWAAKKTTDGKVMFRDVVSMLLMSMPEIPLAGKPESKRLFTFKGEVAEGNQLLIHCRVALPLVEFGSSADNYRLESWPNIPREIGYFRMNSCEGRLEAFDTQERPNIAEVATDVFLRMFQHLNELPDLDQMLGLGSGQMVTGEPVTPDDDPNRPSPLRLQLDEGELLPEHRIEIAPSLLDLAGGNGDAFEVDVYRVRACTSIDRTITGWTTSVT